MNTATTQNTFQVWQITREIRSVLEVTFDDVWVVGEISNYKHHSSGHIYFTLQDERASLSAAFFRQWNRFRSFEPRNGDAVVVHGRIGVYEPRGSYQIIVDRIEPAGEGARKAQLEKLKARFAAEGLFDPERKRPLPAFPRTIGVVTSSNGAALRDILSVTRRRFPNVHILVASCKVQGDGSGAEIVSAIERLNRDGRADVLIVGRGGGAAEDLWSFNEEAVCRAMATSAIPVVSAVGHETDTTLADMVADLRAPTPSAAAEVVSQNQAEWLEAVREAWVRLERHMTRVLRERARHVTDLRRRLRDPKTYLDERGQRVDELMTRLESAWRWKSRSHVRELEMLHRRLQEQSPRKSLERRRQAVRQLTSALRAAARVRHSDLRGRLGRETARLDALSPLGVLNRGYAIAFDEHGHAIRDAAQAKPGDRVDVRVHKGKFTARVEKT